jgi:hypothetical protein
MGFKEIGCGDMSWILVGQEKIWNQVLVSRVMNRKETFLAK